MKKNIEKNKNMILFILILIVIFISIFILNNFSVFTSDDYSFLYDYIDTSYREGITRITSISQIITSMKNLYLNVNGRIVPHFLLQLILIYPKYLFNILNSLMFVILGIVIYKTIVKDKIISKFKPFTLILIYSLMYLMLPSFGITILWCSGSLNYMWSMVFVLVYFQYLIKLFEKERLKFHNYIIVFLLSLTASNTVENFSLSVLFFTIISILYNTLKNKKFKLWNLIMILGSLVGIFVLFTANPGSRISGIDISVFRIIKKTIVIFKSSGIYSLICLFLIILCIITYYKNNKKNIKCNKDNYILMYLLSGIFSLMPIYAVNYYAMRMTFMFYTIIIIITIYVYEKLINKTYIKNIISCVFLLLTIYVYIFVAYKDVKLSHDEYIKIENIIYESKEKGELNVVIPNYRKEYSKYTVFDNVYAYPYESVGIWINRWMAFYYGVKSISMK